MRLFVLINIPRNLLNIYQPKRNETMQEIDVCKNALFDVMVSANTPLRLTQDNLPVEKRLDNIDQAYACAEAAIQDCVAYVNLIPPHALHPDSRRRYMRCICGMLTVFRDIRKHAMRMEMHPRRS